MQKSHIAKYLGDGQEVRVAALDRHALLDQETQEREVEEALIRIIDELGDVVLFDGTEVFARTNEFAEIYRYNQMLADTVANVDFGNFKVIRGIDIDEFRRHLREVVIQI